VITAIVIGIALGHFYPELGYPDFGEQMKPLVGTFIKLIKMIIASIIFCTVVHGIASMQDMKKVGRVGLKTLIYFEVLTTMAALFFAPATGTDLSLAQQLGMSAFCS
jgi:aerobic C4-dicarboxylate transport protein